MERFIRANRCESKVRPASRELSAGLTLASISLSYKPGFKVDCHLAWFDRVLVLAGLAFLKSSFFGGRQAEVYSMECRGYLVKIRVFLWKSSFGELPNRNRLPGEKGLLLMGF